MRALAIWPSISRCAMRIYGACRRGGVCRRGCSFGVSFLTASQRRLFHNQATSRQPVSAVRLPLKKKLLFSAIIVFGLFATAECILRLAGLGPGRRADVYEDLTSDAAGRINICALGGSTTEGYPFNPRGGFPEWLEAMLREAIPDGNVQVANCGITSAASNLIVSIFDDMTSRHRVDAAIIYAGHNEWFETELPVTVNIRPMPDTAFRAILSRTAIYYNLWRLSMRLSGEPKGVEPGLGNILAFKNRVSRDYVGGDVHAHIRSEALKNFIKNLNRIAELARERKVELILCIPAGNLADWPPLLSLWPHHLEKVEYRRWLKHYLAGLEALPTDPEKARTELELAAAICDEHAGLLYTLGKALEASGKKDRARASLARARDLDARQCRADSDIVAAIRYTAERENAELVDVPALFDRCTTTGIANFELFLDNCHPKLRGNRIIAEAAAVALQRRLDKGNTWQMDSIPGEDELAARLRLDKGFRATSLVQIANRCRWPHQLNDRVAFWGADKHYPHDLSHYTHLYEQALELSETAVMGSVSRTDAYCCFHLAQAYAQLGRNDDAIQWARRSINLKETLLDPHRLLVQTYKKAGMKEESDKAARRIDELLNTRQGNAAKVNLQHSAIAGQQ